MQEIARLSRSAPRPILALKAGGRGGGQTGGASGGVAFMMHPSGGHRKNWPEVPLRCSPLQPGAFLLWKAVDQDGSENRKPKSAIGPLWFSDSSAPLPCQFKMETLGERGIGREGGPGTGSLAGFWARDLPRLAPPPRSLEQVPSRSNGVLVNC